MCHDDLSSKTVHLALISIFTYSMTELEGRRNPIFPIWNVFLLLKEHFMAYNIDTN